MNKDIKDLLIQALGQTAIDGELNYEKFKAATQDLLVNNPQERKFYLRIADKKFWNLCKRAEDASPNEALIAEKMAAKYLQNEFGLSEKHSCEMARYTARAIFEFKNGQSLEEKLLEKECKKEAKASVVKEETLHVSDKGSKRPNRIDVASYRNLNTNRPAGKDINRLVVAGTGNVDLRSPKKKNKGKVITLTVLLASLLMNVGLAIMGEISITEILFFMKESFTNYNYLGFYYILVPLGMQIMLVIIRCIQGTLITISKKYSDAFFSLLGIGVTMYASMSLITYICDYLAYGSDSSSIIEWFLKVILSSLVQLSYYAVILIPVVAIEATVLGMINKTS